MVLSKPPKNIRDFIIQRLRFSSKGLWYYKWKAHISLRASLPLLYITNITAACSIILFTSTASLYTLFPLFIKSFGDAIITYKYHQCLKYNWDLRLFLINMLIHPFYITLIGAMGPFYKVKWKE